MMISTTTVIGFRVPDEHEQMMEFCEKNNVADWQVINTTHTVCFLKKQTVFTNWKGDEEERRNNG